MSTNSEQPRSDVSEQSTSTIDAGFKSTVKSQESTLVHNTVIRPKSLKVVEKVQLQVASQVVPSAPKPAPTAQMSLTSRPITLPPRPQPGRKPMQDTHGTKRQEQNRCAQRNFRKRKAENLDQLKQENEEIRREKQELEVRYQGLHLDSERVARETRATLANLEQQVQDHLEARQNAEQEVLKIRGELDAMRKELVEQRKLSSTSRQASSTPQYTTNMPTPVIPSPIMLPPMQVRNCGTCEPKNCLCFAESVNLPDNDAPVVSSTAVTDQDLAIDFTSWRGPSSSKAPPPPQKLAPGTCERCQVDPEQRAYCLGMAQQRPTFESHKPMAFDETEFNIQPLTKRPRLDSPSDIQHARFAIPCMDAYPLYKQFRPIASSVTEDMLRNEVLRKQMLSSTKLPNPSQPPPPRIETSAEAGVVVHMNDGGVTKDGQRFSAQEVDLCQVLATLHQQGSSSGSRTSVGSRSISGRSEGGNSYSSSGSSSGRNRLGWE